MKKIKAYIIYGGSGDMLDASLVLENGWVPFRHFCSHPAYMLGDLWEHRPERQEILKRMGYEVEIIGKPIAGSNSPDIPEGLIALHQDEKNWKTMADSYEAIASEIKLSEAKP